MNKIILFVSCIVAFASCSPKLSADYGWERKRWVLIEMKGVPVQLGGGGRDAHVEFRAQEKKFYGNAGCNTMSGNYMIDKKELRFNDVVTTKMSCPDISFETTFLDVLKQVDKFSVDGNRMELKDGRKTVLVLQSR